MLTKFEKDVAKMLLFFAFAIAACKFSNGIFGWVMAILGCYAALTRNAKWICIFFVFTPLLIFFSPTLVSGAYLGPAIRIGQIMMLFCLLLSPIIRSRRDSIPIGVLYLYSLVALISSIDGWMPTISCLKVFNFVLFLMGISVIGKIMQESEESLYQLRCVLLGLAFFIVVGSAIVYFIPSVGYSMEVQKAAIWGVYTSGAEVASREGKSLFNGVMNHSQTLATNVPMWFSWTLCDMLTNERKPTKMHAVIMVIAPFLMYMSRSRTAFVVFVVSMFMIWLTVLPKIQLSSVLRDRVKMTFYCLIITIVAGLSYFQVRDQTISKWLRKSDDVMGDSRGLIESVTESRMGLVEYNLRDFKLNPLLGKGFQVMDWHSAAYQSGQISLLSAPIEKGVMPLMVLGETGIIGGIVFVVFLIVFYSMCLKYNYRCLMCLFTVLLAANMSEAGFFSPGGGTAQWTSTVIGGFCLDMIVKRRNNSYLKMREWTGERVYG